MRFRNEIEYRVSGRYALFSDPVTRMGGEKLSYPVPTYEAIKGITESCYWKPSIMWVPSEVRILNAIRTEAKSIRPISYNSTQNTLSVYTYLVDVAYEVRAHILPNPYRTEPDLIVDGQNENKHHHIARRMIQKGGRRDCFLGTRECQAYIEPCEFGKESGYYDGSGEIDLGVMYHGFDYPDETGEDKLRVRLWHAKMVDGIITFPSPAECNPGLKRLIRSTGTKVFGQQYGNFSGLSETALAEEWKDIIKRGEANGMDAETL